MTDIDEAEPDDTEGDEAMSQALQLHRCLAECHGAGTADAAFRRRRARALGMNRPAQPLSLCSLFPPRAPGAA